MNHTEDLESEIATLKLKLARSQELYESSRQVAESRRLELIRMQSDSEYHVSRLADGIRKHRDYRGDDRCWMDDEELYKLLPEGFTAPSHDTSVEIGNCMRFIDNRENPATEYVSPQREIASLKTLVGDMAQHAKDGMAYECSKCFELFLRAEVACK